MRHSAVTSEKAATAPSTRPLGSRSGAVDKRIVMHHFRLSGAWGSSPPAAPRQLEGIDRTVRARCGEGRLPRMYRSRIGPFSDRLPQVGRGRQCRAPALRGRRRRARADRAEASSGGPSGWR